MSLSGQQRKKLQEALINAFPNTTSLEQMLSFELDRNLRAIAGEGSLQDIVFKLIQTAESQGWIEDLVRAACESNPGNPLLTAIAGGLLPNHEPETSSVSSPNIPQKQTNQQQKILILTAIPHGLRLDKEIREIEEAIRRATNRDLFEIRIRTAVRPQDIRRAIAEEQPQIVHFCGHGLSDGSLLLEDDGGNNKPVTPQGLASLFKLHTDYVNCVLLNACHSEKSAVAISQYINNAIGMNQPIEDKAAIAFAQGFYDGLGFKNSGNQDLFQRAFDEGMVAIQMENLSQGSIPVLKKKTLNENEIEELSDIAVIGLEASEVGVDYTKLRDLLKAKNFAGADLETARKLMWITDRQRGECLTITDIVSISTIDLRTINRLWLAGSKGRFGFSVQKRIWIRLGGQPATVEYDEKTFHDFMNMVGWAEEEGITPDLRAKYGHLPMCVFVLCRGYSFHKWWAFMDGYDQRALPHFNKTIHVYREFLYCIGVVFVWFCFLLFWDFFILYGFCGFVFVLCCFVLKDWRKKKNKNIEREAQVLEWRAQERRRMERESWIAYLWFLSRAVRTDCNT